MTAIATQTNSKSDVAAMAKAAGRYPAGIGDQALQGRKADESKSRLEEGAEASIGSTDPATSRTA